MSGVLLPVTGSGSSNVTVATDAIGGQQYEYVKLIDGTSGSTVVVSAST